MYDLDSLLAGIDTVDLARRDALHKSPYEFVLSHAKSYSQLPGPKLGLVFGVMEQVLSEDESLKVLIQVSPDTLRLRVLGGLRFERDLVLQLNESRRELIVSAETDQVHQLSLHTGKAKWMLQVAARVYSIAHFRADWYFLADCNSLRVADFRARAFVAHVQLERIERVWSGIINNLRVLSLDSGECILVVNIHAQNYLVVVSGLEEILPSARYLIG